LGGFYVINNKIVDAVAQSDNWKYVVHLTALLHVGWFLGSYYLIRRTPFILAPFLYLELFPERVLQKVYFLQYFQ